jgi:RNA polymerase sigma factor (sigma-70 family)
LVSLVRQGRITAFETLVKRYEMPLFNYIRRMVGSATDAEDLFQETFLRVHTHLGSFRATARFRPWVYRIATNLCKDHLRYQRRHAHVSELPESVRALSPNPILLGFKYTEHPYLLAADVRKLDDMPVRVAAIDRAEITTVVTDEGIAATRARYYVRNNLKQFLRVEVPQGAEVWGAEVAGQVVKPARDNESNTVLVPLLKSAETNQRLGAFPVEVVYMMRMQHTPRLAGRLALYAPATDILANEVQWEVLVPESQRVYRSRGDLKPLRPARLREEAPSPRPLAEFKSTVSGMAQLERADRQKDAEIARGIVPASAPVRV